MFGLPFPTYIGWFLGPGIMIFTFIVSFGLLKRYERRKAQETEKSPENNT